MPTCKHKLVSSLTKVFPDQEPTYAPENLQLTALKNETISFQFAFCFSPGTVQLIDLAVDSPIVSHIRVRSVVLSPATYVAHDTIDDNYERPSPGLFPDILRDSPERLLYSMANHWQAFWIDIEVPTDMKAGTYPIELTLTDTAGKKYGTETTQVTIYDAVLPEQTLLHTEWFHADCLANYYDVPVFSPRHWEIIEHFVHTAAHRGCTMLLTPLFTPPLDTAPGGERTTVQLVGVTKTGDDYLFDFTRLQQWIAMCKRCGIQQLEMSHLFTQWGATAAPKVIATVDGVEQQIFGWDTPAVGGEYTTFLRSFLPQLIQQLEQTGMEDSTWFHISDEPSLDHYNSYIAAKESIADLLEGYPIIDALSSFEFYKTGAVPRPIPSNDHIEPFLDAGVENLWTYYCTGQSVGVSNRFMSMPSQRNRIYGTQLYKFGIQGILHWGYNFYNSGHSLRPIDPYRTTDAWGIFPAGDPFLVYPQADGRPEESIRLLVLYHAISDHRALTYLEQLTSREYVLSLIDEPLATPLTFSNYPTSDTYLLQLRARVNREIANHQ